MAKAPNEDGGWRFNNWQIGWDPGKGDRAALVILHWHNGRATVVADFTGEQATKMAELFAELAERG